MTSDRRFFSGDSLAQALNQAAQFFELSPGEIKYKLVEKRHGFLRARRKVVIEVDGNNARLEPTADSSAGGPPAEPAASDALGESRASESGPASTPEGESTAEPDPSAGPESSSAPAVESAPNPAPAEPPVRPDLEQPAEPVGPTGFPSADAPSAETLEAERPTETDPALSAEPSVQPPPRAEPPTRVPVSNEVETAEWRLDRAPAGPEGSEEETEGVEGAEAAGSGVELPEAPLPARSRFPVAEGEEATAAADALERILALAGLDLEKEILEGEEELLVELWGDDQDILLRDRGRLLLAIQHLMPRVIRGLIGRSVVCKVDCDDFHMIREESLRDMAQRAADEVRRGGRPKTLEPMSPDERRIVHLTLADYPGVETESHGSGLFKRVMVRLGQGDRPRGSYRR